MKDALVMTGVVFWLASLMTAAVGLSSVESVDRASFRYDVEFDRERRRRLRVAMWWAAALSAVGTAMVVAGNVA